MVPPDRNLAFVALALVASAALTVPLAHAQEVAKPVYRCPGPPVLYTDTLTPQEARDKGCRTIEAAPVTVVQPPPKPRAATGTTPGAAPAAAARPADGRIDPAAQQKRDSDARRILAEELRREEERLAVMLAEYNGGQPERQGDERNYQRYLDRVAELKAAIARKESDVAALRRELAKLPP